jgi:hypothetical protein
MPKVLIGVLIGIIVGGALTFYFFVGVRRASQIPGDPIQAPDAAVPPGTAQIVLRQDFFNEVLGTIFRDMNDPAFQLASRGDDLKAEYALLQDAQPCESRISILPEGSGVQTALRFDNNRIAAPLAFNGSYNSMFGCMNFTGWAQANLELRFDSAQQAVFGIINVETVNLDGVNPVLGGLVTPLVQTSLNGRVNPIRIIDGKQIALDMPIASTGGKLQATVKDVRADLKDNALNLYVTYEFHGSPTL